MAIPGSSICRGERVAVGSNHGLCLGTIGDVVGVLWDDDTITEYSLDEFARIVGPERQLVVSTPESRAFEQAFED